MVGVTAQILPPRMLLDVDLHIPDIGDDVAAALLPEPRLDRNADAPLRTSWEVTDAQSGRWPETLATIGLGFQPSRRLGDIATIVAGKVRASNRSELPLPGLVPVCMPLNARSGRWVPTAWAEPLEPITDGRSIVLPAVRRYRTSVAPAGWTAGHDTFVIQPNETIDSARLSAWLSSTQGSKLLERHSAGAFIPRIALTILRKIPVPNAFPSAANRVPNPERDLAARIEALWS